MRLFPLLERLGVHLTPNHFYEPVPDLRTLPDRLFEERSDLPGVEMREAAQLALLARMSDFRDEYASFPFAREAGSSRYFQRNSQFERVDAEVLYAVIRLHNPRRVIEIGSGYSTSVAAQAIARNRKENPQNACELICIEPYPRPFLSSIDEIARIIEKPVQELPVQFFEGLGEDDILFIDSSHVLKIGSDVQFEFLEVLPRVAPGVLVQVHDIFFPTEYPRVFVRDWHRFFTEQYLLQAFLAFNSQFEVVWSSSWMAHRHEGRIREVFPSFGRGGMWPSSLWLRRRACTS